MKILHLGHHCCIRMSKQCYALIENGHEVHGLGNRQPLCVDELKTFSIYHTVEQLKSYLNLVKDYFDIIHIHNEPSWLVMPVLETLETTKAKVIFDVHDSMIYRTDDHMSVTEQIAFDSCDGFVFVGDKCADMSVEAFNIKKPYTVLPSLVNKRFYKYKDWERIGGLIYEGGVYIDKKNPPFMQYSDYRPLAKKCKDLGIPFRLYSPHCNDERKEYFKDFYETSCLPYNLMIKNLGHYDWGLTGNEEVYPNWQVAIPNKMFEYMAGGIPIVAMNAEKVSEFVEEFKVGISVSGIEELAERWDERLECQKNVIKHRDKFTMENFIYKTEDLYKEVM